MKVKLKTSLTKEQVEKVIKEQNRNLHEHQINPTLLALTDPGKLSFGKRMAAAGLTRMMSKDTKEYIVTALQHLSDTKAGLVLLSYKKGEVVLNYPDFFYEMLQKSESKTIPEKIWYELKRVGMMQKTTDSELKELVNDFTATEGKWMP